MIIDTQALQEPRHMDVHQYFIIAAHDEKNPDFPLYAYDTKLAPSPVSSAAYIDTFDLALIALRHIKQVTRNLEKTIQFSIQEVPCTCRAFCICEQAQHDSRAIRALLQPITSAA